MLLNLVTFSLFILPQASLHFQHELYLLFPQLFFLGQDRHIDGTPTHILFATNTSRLTESFFRYVKVAFCIAEGSLQGLSSSKRFLILLSPNLQYIWAYSMVPDVSCIAFLEKILYLHDSCDFSTQCAYVIA